MTAKRYVEFNEYANDIIAALPHGILLTTQANDKVNSMVIGWGTVGVNWGKPTFVTYVREGRFTRGQLDANPEFTINIPVGDYNKKIIATCGGKSGRDIDKVAEAGLTLVEPDEITVPGIREFPLTLECRVVYQQLQEESALPADILERFYPTDVPSTAVGSNKDAHISYYGEIVSAYIIEG